MVDVSIKDAVVEALVGLGWTPPPNSKLGEQSRDENWCGPVGKTHLFTCSTCEQVVRNSEMVAFFKVNCYKDDAGVFVDFNDGAGKRYLHYWIPEEGK